MGFLRDFFDGSREDSLHSDYGADSFLSFRRALDRDCQQSGQSQVYAWTLSPPQRSVGTFRPLTLPPAIRLSAESDESSTDLATAPYATISDLREGYRHRMYRDPEQRLEIPVLVAAVSAPRLLTVFLSLSDILESTVDLVLETSRGALEPGGRRDFLREQMDLPVLQSLLWEYDTMLMNDGQMGLAILDPERPLELQMDEHKLIYIYTHEPEPFERCLREFGIFENENLEVVTERSHCHGSSSEYAWELNRLVRQVCAEEMV